jgi:hypothetical protein
VPPEPPVAAPHDTAACAVPLEASRTTTVYATWLTTTKPSVHNPSLKVCPRPLPRKSNRGRKVKPADFR